MGVQQNHMIIDVKKGIMPYIIQSMNIKVLDQGSCRDETNANSLCFAPCKTADSEKLELSDSYWL